MPALLFDLYGVLLQEQPAADLRAIEEASGQSGDAFWDAYWQCRPGFDAGELSPTQYWDEVAKTTGKPIADFAATVAADYASWSYADESMVDWLMGLVDQGARVGVLSNIPAPLAARIESTQGWLNRLDPVLLSGRLGVAKPDPRVFMKALMAFDLPPEEVLFIDDRALNVEAAAGLGLAVHEFKGLKGLRPLAKAHLGL